MSEAYDDMLVDFLRRRHPTADDEELLERLEKLKLSIRWRREQVVRLTCSQCGETKPTSAFGLHSSRPSGFQSVCKDCDAGRVR